VKKATWEKTIRLTSGGFVKIELTGHPLDMEADDREFVSLLVDRINEYEADAKAYRAESEGNPAEDAAEGLVVMERAK
jgi:hypothetical protein